MFTQDKGEEVRINLAQLAREKENYRSTGWGEKKMNRVFNFLRDYIDFDKGNHTVLDLGCGGMTLGGELAKRPSFNVIGIDIVVELLRRVSKNRTPDIPLTGGDIEYLPFKENSFDLIVHNQVLHHFFDRSIVLNEVYRVLKPGGLLLSLETNGWNPYVYYWHHSPRSKRINLIGDNENPFGVVKFEQELKKAKLKIAGRKMINFDFINALAPFDELFGKIPVFKLVFGGSMMVCSQK